ncbi:hypothetical protein [Flavobacterium sp.]|uniref:hypothetical protein n=1 Tax=Flavobacterium sp. TaxID=239 RepID=UPI00260599CD|nr:hypothetical protein [Flavobacterium sp.]
MEEQNTNKTKLDIGEQINDAFEIYKKIALMGGLAMTTIYVVVIMLSIIALGFFFNMEQMPELLKDFKPEQLGLVDQMKFSLGVLLFVALLSPFMAGMLKMARDADNNEEVTFSSIFFYINSPQFIQIVLATTTITILSNGLNLLVKHFVAQPPANFIGIIISFTISLFTYLVIPHIIFKNMNFINAIKKSITKIADNLLIVILLIIIAFILACLGIFAFCLGILFTIPFMYAMNYAIYKKLNS